MVILIKIISLIFGTFIGFLCGIEGSIYGDMYDSGLTDKERKHLSEKSHFFKLSQKLEYISLVLGTPIGFIIIFVIYVVGVIFDPNSFYCVFDKYEKILGLCFCLYLIFLLIGYFIGFIWCDNLKSKHIYGKQ